MAYQPIENYGIIGNMRTAALVGRDGSIDWLCFPHFDSPSVFAAILDDAKGGRFSIAPKAARFTIKQFYWPETNVLITRFLSSEGVGEIEDFMPVGVEGPALYHQLIRRVKVVRGKMTFCLTCHPAFDYARTPHETHLNSNGAVFSTAALTLGLATTLPLKQDEQESVLSLHCSGENMRSVSCGKSTKGTSAGPHCRTATPSTCSKRRCSFGTTGCRRAVTPDDGAKWCPDRPWP